MAGGLRGGRNVTDGEGHESQWKESDMSNVGTTKMGDCPEVYSNHRFTNAKTLNLSLHHGEHVPAACACGDCGRATFILLSVRGKGKE